MEDLRDCFSLRKGEYVVENWCFRFVPKVRIRALVATYPKGTLVLTNQRLKCIEPGDFEFSGSVFHKKMKAKSWNVREIPLESIKEISFGKVDRHAGFDFGADMYVFTEKTSFVFKHTSTNFLFKHAEKGKGVGEYLKEKLIGQMEERRKGLERKEQRVIIDFSFLKSYMEKGGVLLTTLKCPDCGAKIQLPKKGTQTICRYCGSTIYAENVFDKIKELIE